MIKAVVVDNTGAAVGGPVIPIEVLASAAGQPVEGKITRVVQVTDADIATNGYKVVGGRPTPVIVATGVGVDSVGGPAIPVYVVQGSLSPVVPIVYLLLDRFTTNAAAPLATPRTCEPGPGTLNIVDTNNTIAIASQQLTFSGAPAANDRVVSASAFARQAGRAFLLRLPSITTIGTGGGVRIGLEATANGSGIDIGFDLGAVGPPPNYRIKTGVSVIDTINLAASGPYDFAFVMRGIGGFLFVRNGASGAYTLAWVYNTITTAQFAKIFFNAATSNTLTADDFRVSDLTGAFATDFGIATDHQMTIVNGTTFVIVAQSAIVEWTINYTGVLCSLYPRNVDANNRWEVNAQADGTLNLVEDVAGVRTSRASAAAVFAATNTYRIVATMDVNVFKLYVNNVLKASYTDPSSFHVNATSGLVNAVGGGISEIASWPRTVAINA